MQNQQIKNIKLLQKKSKARTEQNAFIIEGIKMFEESKAEGSLVKSYFSKVFMRIKLKKNLIFQDINYEIIEDDTFKNYLTHLPSRCISACGKAKI